MFTTVLRAAEREGLSGPALLRETGVTPEHLEPTDARLPQPAYMKLWELIERDVKDPFFGLHFSERMVEAGTFSAVGFAARSSSTYGEALERIVRYGRVLNQVEIFALEVHGREACMLQNPRPGEAPWPRHKAESSMANYVLRGRAWTGQPWVPFEVRFQHAAPADLSELHRVFACPLRFEQPRNEVRFDRAILELRFHTAAPDLGQYLAQRAEALAATVPEEDLLAGVRSALRAALPSGTPSLARIAKQLGLSERSLQRRLAESETSFAALVDEVRRELALRIVDDRRVNLEDIGFLLGFADSRGFRRAFERWTGQSPRAWRTRSSSSPAANPS